MNNFLRKYGLTSDFTLTLDADRTRFVEALRQVVEPGATGILSDIFEVWQPDRKPYKGQVRTDGFELRQQISFFQANGLPNPLATGVILQLNGQLIIRVTITAAVGLLKVFAVLIFLFFTALMGVLLFAFFSGKMGQEAFFLFPLVVMIFTGIFYIIHSVSRAGVRQTEQEIKQDFFLIGALS
jgi:hypothetical protein